MQGQRWLQIWTDFVINASTKGKGKCHVHMLCNGVPPSYAAKHSLDVHDVDLHLEDNAQHGELQIAMLAGFVDEVSGLHMESYTSPEVWET